jgi:hypothetical protein
VFDRDLSGDLGASSCPESGTELELGTVFRFRRIGILGLIYIIIGLVVAWQHNYITVHLLKLVLSAILAVLLWWLVLLGVNLHI